MSAADEFPLPPGDPGAVKAAGSALQDVSTDLSALGTRIGREHAGMAAAWQGDAAAAAGTETATLASIATEEGGRVGDGVSALSDYGTALETAVTEVTAIRRQAIYGSIRSQALAPLRMHYRAVIETLDRAARTAAGRLTAAVPEYRSGMTPGQLSLAARDAVARRLPSVLRQDGQQRARDLAAQLQPLLEHGKQIPAALLAQLEADKDNPWFAN